MPSEGLSGEFLNISNEGIHILTDYVKQCVIEYIELLSSFELFIT